MTYEEANGLDNGLDSSIGNCGQAYWLGSAGSNGGVWRWGSSGNISRNSLNYAYGVRPVIIVSTSAL